jgi:hypothetical protein
MSASPRKQSGGIHETSCDAIVKRPSVLDIGAMQVYRLGESTVEIGNPVDTERF